MKSSILLLLLLAASAPTSTIAMVCLDPTTASSQASLTMLHRHRSRNNLLRSNDANLSILDRTPPSERRRRRSCTHMLVSRNTDHEVPPPPSREKLKRFLKSLKTMTSDYRLRVMSTLTTTRTAKVGSPDIPPAAPTIGASTELQKEQPMISKEKTTGEVLFQKPQGERWAIADPNTDFSGSWKPIASQEFKNQYDEYLVNCSQSYFFRKVIVNGIAYQTEIITQKDQGTNLEIFATNPAGTWNRTLVASGTTNSDNSGTTPAQSTDESANNTFVATNATIVDPDGDTIQVEAWWADQGTVHRSIMRGKPRLEGGSMVSVRYLDGPDTLICESSFHPSSCSSSSKFVPAHVTWKFQRV